MVKALTFQDPAAYRPMSIVQVGFERNADKAIAVQSIILYEDECEKSSDLLEVLPGNGVDSVRDNIIRLWSTIMVSVTVVTKTYTIAGIKNGRTTVLATTGVKS